MIFMPQLPANKQDALDLILQMSESLYSRTKFDDLEAIDETLEQRHQLIEQFFCDFKKSLSDSDLQVFRTIQENDEIFKRNMEENKIALAQKIVGERKSKQRMRLYTKISKQF